MSWLRDVLVELRINYSGESCHICDENFHFQHNKSILEFALACFTQFKNRSRYWRNKKTCYLFNNQYTFICSFENEHVQTNDLINLRRRTHGRMVYLHYVIILRKNSVFFCQLQLSRKLLWNCSNHSKIYWEFIYRRFLNWHYLFKLIWFSLYI